MFDNTLPVSMSDNSQLSLDNSEMTTSVKVISYNFPDMIDESSGTFTDYTASNLDNGYHTTSSVVSCRSFITSSNYYNINNNLKVSEHAYLFSSGSNDYWSWRKPSDIQVGDYLLGINEEIRQVSSSEHIVSGTLGLSQINVEDVDTLFVNGYLVHNLDDDFGGGGGGGTPSATFNFVVKSASIHINDNYPKSPFVNVIDKDGITSYAATDVIRESSVRLRATISQTTSGGAGTMQNVKMGMRTNSSTDDFRFIETTLGLSNNGLGSPLSGSGITNRTIDIQLSGSDLFVEGEGGTGTPAIKQIFAANGDYDGHIQFTASNTSGTHNLSNPGIRIVEMFVAQFPGKSFSFNEPNSTPYDATHTTASDGGVLKEERDTKNLRDLFAKSTQFGGFRVTAPNFSSTDSQTQEGILAGSGFSPAGNREQETFSISELHSASLAG